MNKFILILFIFILIVVSGCVATETPTPSPPATIDIKPTQPPPSPTPVLLTSTPTLPESQEGAQPALKGRIDIGDNQLFINCIGSGTPTVIMEAGWNDVSDTWSRVQPEVAEFTRVCSYDRAGLGKSGPGPESPPILQVVIDLNKLLEAAEVEEPYILVGHSMGGLYNRLFADRYPEKTAGLVLVDSAHPDMYRRNLAVLPPESPGDGESLKFYRDWFTNAMDDPTLKMDPKLFEAGSLGDLPLIVLTAPSKDRADDFPVELSDKFDQIWVVLNQELATLSSNSDHIYAEESGHFIQHDQPELVIDAILQMIKRLR